VPARMVNGKVLEAELVSINVKRHRDWWFAKL
jgi:hypothetical protein